MFRKLTDKTYKMCEWFMRLAFVNLLWILFTVLGLGLFGWAPATAATVGVSRKMILSPDEEIPLFRTFLHLYKQEFIRANKIGSLLAFGGVSLYVSIAIMNEMTNVLVLKLLLIAVILLFGMIILLIFPVCCHYRLTVQQSIRYSLVIGLANLHYLFLLIILLVLLFLVYVTLPGAMIFYLVSFPIIMVTHISLKIFQNIDHQTLSIGSTSR